MEALILSKIIPIILSATPLSLLIINLGEKIFSKNNPKLGETTAICMNVTGTLTEDNLMVRTIYFDKYKAKIKESSKFVKITEKEDDKGIIIEKTELKKNIAFKLIGIISYLCRHQKTHNIELTIQDFIKLTEINKHKTENDYEIIEKIKSSEEKKLSTVVALKRESKEIFAFSKGHPLKILEKCTKTIIEEKKVEMDHSMRRRIRTYIKRMNKNGQKVIAFAYKPLPLKQLPKYTESFTEHDMTFLGLIGVTNPLKTNLKKSADLIKEAGIKTYILTSVKERKATAIARLQNIINPHYFESITGEYLKNLSDQKLIKMLSNKEKDYVFAELEKEDEKRIIKLLTDNGETVAVINENNKKGLKGVVDGIKKGRIINRNYPKYAHHAITCKIAEFILMLTVLMFKLPLPLTIALILILDLNINLILELALRVNKSEKDVMSKKYHPKKIKILSKGAIPQLLINGILTGTILSMLFIWSLIRYGWNPGEALDNADTAFIKSSTIVFLLLAISQIVKTYGLKNNKNLYLALTTILSAMIIYIIMGFPFIQDALNLTNLSSIEWQILSFLSVVIFIVNEVNKFLFTKKNNDI